MWFSFSLCRKSKFDEVMQPGTINVGVFCGSNDEMEQPLMLAARDLGAQLATQKYGLITGGYKSGLMRAAVQGYIDAVPNLKERAQQHIGMDGILDLKPFMKQGSVANINGLHKRLQNFVKKCSVAVILPGGFGTLHELFEFLVQKQQEDAKIIVILLNTNNFWGPLLQQFNNMVAAKALKQEHLDLLLLANSPEDCIALIAQHFKSDIRPAREASRATVREDKKYKLVNLMA